MQPRIAAGMRSPPILIENSGAYVPYLAISIHDFSRLRIIERQRRNQELLAGDNGLRVGNPVPHRDWPPDLRVVIQFPGYAAERLALTDNMHLAVVGRLAADIFGFVFRINEFIEGDREPRARRSA